MQKIIKKIFAYDIRKEWNKFVSYYSECSKIFDGECAKCYIFGGLVLRYNYQTQYDYKQYKLTENYDNY